jgi:hypothetical protein
MAYGVKYRLIFSDVLGNGKKVEILKKDYTGDVLPMIGGANPVQISWQSSDDFYKPIIGSKCTLSLLVTDSVSYDDFYKFDEREFKVVVSYAKSQGEIYADRVEADGGTCESFECVDNVLNNFETISTYYKNRVVEDGGEVESLSCVADAITDDNFYRWGAYWSGFLVVDRFKEKMTTPPFGLQFNAFDGLGTLAKFAGPSGYNNDSTPLNLTALTRLKEILANLNLDLDIYIASDIRSPYFGGVENFETDIGLLSRSEEQTNDFDILNAKEQLLYILESLNLRIFQSYNRWYIVESTNIFDYYIKDQLYNESDSTGVVPTGIRERITSQLENTKKEFIDFRTYDKDGTSLGTERLPVLYDNNNELKAINNDLAREYLQPLSFIEFENLYKNTGTINFGSGFEYGSFGFTIYDLPYPPFSALAEIATDEIAFRGQRSMKLTDAATDKCFSTQTSFNPQNIEIKNYTIGFKYYVEFITTAPITLNADVRFRIVTTDTVGTKYWNNDDETFQSSVYMNEINVTNGNQFLAFSTNLKDDGLTIGSLTNLTLTIEFYNTICSTPGYETTYFDNVDIIRKISSPTSIKQDYNYRLENFDVNTAKKTFKTNNNLQPVYYRSRENFGSVGNPNLWRNLVELQAQNIANDYREFVTRYEGTFRNLKVQPLSTHNKVWFYWNGHETDPQTTIIDGLQYDVKNAVFKLKSHLPNNDDDENLTFVIS